MIKMRSIGGISFVLFLSVFHPSFEIELRDRSRHTAGTSNFAPSDWSNNFWGMGGGKERRASAGGGGGGNLGLFPFPRVGRGYHPQSDHSGHLRERDFHQLAMKRQGLIPFPRVGRGRSQELESMSVFNDPSFPEDNSNLDSNDDQLKRSRASDANGGMWFGPRLGKRPSGPSLLLPYALYSELLSPSKDFTPRLGREQDEDDETSNNQQFEAETETTST